MNDGINALHAKDYHCMKEVEAVRIVRIVNNLQETEGLAQELALHVGKGFVLGLEGDLGAGKTTFTKYLGRALGIQDTINSPTFTIMKVYEHNPPLYHIDAYRLEGETDDFDLEEYIIDDGVAIIEWYKNIESFLPDSFLSIEFEWLGETKRRCIIEGRGEYAEIAASLGD